MTEIAREDNLENIEGVVHGIETEMQKNMRKILIASTTRKRIHQVILPYLY